MKIKTLLVGPIETNCYVVSCPKTKEAVVIDPGDEAEKIIEVIKEQNLKVKYIINTHGHHDHIGANKELKNFTNAEILIHKADAEMLTNSNKNLSFFTGGKSQEQAADRELEEKDIIKFGNINLEVVHTPGHTLGGICLNSKEEKVCFTGDTLFNGSVGRTDLPGGNYGVLMSSIREKLAVISNQTTIYPGHGPKSTIGNEKAINPFLK